MRFLLEAKNLVFVRNKQVEKILVGAGFNILDFRRSLFSEFLLCFSQLLEKPLRNSRNDLFLVPIR